MDINEARGRLGNARTAIRDLIKIIKAAPNASEHVGTVASLEHDIEALNKLEHPTNGALPIVEGPFTAAFVAQLRALRLWHWNRALAERKAAEGVERTLKDAGMTDQERRNVHRHADHHIKAVQTLNDFFPAGDTAEQETSR